ncbi:type I methionyl aminopeptidase [Sulfurospirillum sp. 1612]|uniref:type I methionyl aminopeptidase n=1 Tax=Sulfurospirillum sp. 1612 TaxID=3094835 RepID=UPI002F925CCE
MAISLKTPAQIEKMRAANKIVAQTLNYLSKELRPGMTLKEINAMGEDFIYSHGAIPAFKGLYNFPAGVCTSVNQVIIHGIPTDYKIKEGDIVGLDIGTKLDGWFGDAAMTVGVGEISKQDEALIACAKDALYFAIETIEAGMRFKELSNEIEKFINARGFVALRSYCGHGIGRKPHEEPEIPNYLEGHNPKQGPKIKNGMVFCLEPMICFKEATAKVLSDKWSVVSTDGMNGSHYEHCVAVINNKAEILSVE